jgi:lactate permease
VAAAAGRLSALAIAVFAFHMPAGMAGRAAVLGGLTGLLPIGWIVLNIIFLHQLTEQNGSFRSCRTRSPASPRTAGCSCC